MSIQSDIVDPLKNYTTEINECIYVHFYENAKYIKVSKFVFFNKSHEYFYTAVPFLKRKKSFSVTKICMGLEMSL